MKYLLWGWLILCYLRGPSLEIESFYLCTDQQVSHLDGDSGKHGSDGRAFRGFFHQSGPIISHTLQSGLYFTVICLDSKGFHLSVLEGTYCFMRKKKAVKRVLLEKNLIKTENKNGLSKNVPSEWMQFLCRFDLLVPVAWLSPGIPLRRTSKRTS